MWEAAGFGILLVFALAVLVWVVLPPINAERLDPDNYEKRRPF